MDIQVVNKARRSHLPTVSMLANGFLGLLVAVNFALVSGILEQVL